MTSFRIISTSKFSVLAPSDSVNLIPTVPLLSFLNSPQDHLELILSHLTTAGYFLLTYPPATATSTPLHATITATIASLERAFTPSFTSCGYPIPLPWPPSLTKTVGSVYFNEKDVPMYKLGYDDGTGGVEGNDKDKIREYFRVCGGNVGDVESREGVNRGVHLCRYITDMLLSTTLSTPLQARPNSSLKSLRADTGKERAGDFSILYAMNYFNSADAIEWASEEKMYGTDGRLLVLKEHVDPSLFVIEPVITKGVGSLEVFHEQAKEWVLVDGKHSKVHDVIEEVEGPGGGGMIVFVGKAFAKAYGGESIKPTKHRCVAPRKEEIGVQRRTVIYEQKYTEFMGGD